MSATATAILEKYGIERTDDDFQIPATIGIATRLRIVRLLAASKIPNDDHWSLYLRAHYFRCYGRIFLASIPDLDSSTIEMLVTS